MNMKLKITIIMIGLIIIFISQGCAPSTVDTEKLTSTHLPVEFTQARETQRAQTAYVKTEHILQTVTSEGRGLVSQRETQEMMDAEDSQIALQFMSYSKRVCSGEGIPDAGEYHSDNPPYKTVIYYEYGNLVSFKNWISRNYAGSSAQMQQLIPIRDFDNWKINTIQDLELVLCVFEMEERIDSTCPYTNTETGESVSIPIILEGEEYFLRSARNGEILYTFEISESPIACPVGLSIGTDQINGVYIDKFEKTFNQLSSFWGLKIIMPYDST
jgi:hypothetical protein